MLEGGINYPGGRIRESEDDIDDLCFVQLLNSLVAREQTKGKSRNFGKAGEEALLKSVPPALMTFT